MSMDTFARTLRRTGDPDHAAEVAQTEQRITEYLLALNDIYIRAECEGRDSSWAREAAREFEGVL